MRLACATGRRGEGAVGEWACWRDVLDRVAVRERHSSRVDESLGSWIGSGSRWFGMTNA